MTEQVRRVLESALCVILLALFIAVAWGPSRNNGFAYDDHTYVTANDAVLHPSWQNVFADTYPPGKMEAALYRPGHTLSLLCDRMLSDGEPTKWAAVGHLHSMFLHFAIAALLFLFLRSRVRVIPALCASAVFALHPVLTETVVWVSARSDVLVGFWCVVGIHLLHSRRLSLRIRATLLAVVAVIAFGCKESAVVLPLIWWFLWLRRRRDPKAGWVMTLLPVLPSAVALGLCLILRVVLFGSLSPALHAFAGESPTVRYAVAMMSVARYHRLMFLPWGLTVHWPPLPLSLDRLAIGMGVLCALAMAYAIVTGVRNRGGLAGAGCAWFAMALLPCSNILLPIGTIMAERFLYLPLMGATIALAVLLDWCVRKGGKRGRMVLSVLSLCVLVCFTVQTRRQTAVWHDDLSLWRHALVTQPQDALAETAVVYYLLVDGDECATAEAIVRWRMLTQRLAELPPGVSNELGQERVEWISHKVANGSRPLSQDSITELMRIGEVASQGQIEQASEAIVSLISANPENKDLRITYAQMVMGRAGADNSESDEFLTIAFEQLAKAGELDPSEPRVYALRGSCYKRREQYQNAIESYSAALMLSKDFRAYYNRAMAYQCTGALPAALADLRMALTLAPIDERPLIEAAIRHLLTLSADLSL